MPVTNRLKAVVAQPGRPLYQTVKEAVRDAIDSAIFRPGEQMPSTKELSDQLSVSLVTAHRALQELVSEGVLHRTQGKGTFVHDQYSRDRVASDCRIGLVMHEESSLANFAFAQVLEGVRQEAHARHADLLLLRSGEDVRNECNAYLCLEPLVEEVAAFVERVNKRQPVLVLGAQIDQRNVSCVAVDDRAAAARAVEHLAAQGHRRLGYVGGADDVGDGRDQWAGFAEACRVFATAPAPSHIVRAAGRRLNDLERAALSRMLSGPQRPSAILAGEYHLALEVYAAAGKAGLRVGHDLAVVGVDDPPSAAFLAPPLTTVRRPLLQIGREGVAMLCEYLRKENPEFASRTLSAELIVRQSSGPVTPGGAGA